MVFTRRCPSVPPDQNNAELGAVSVWSSCMRRYHKDTGTCNHRPSPPGGVSSLPGRPAHFLPLQSGSAGWKGCL